MTYVFDLDARPDVADVPDGSIASVLGGKGANLAVMAVDLGLPVPPAFTISTAACRDYLATGWPAGLDDEIRAHVATMERRVGRRFGDPADPLLVSVRSGAPVSMPGMMDTILDLGLNDATTAGLAAVTGDPAFAEDCRMRFDALFTSVVGVGAVPADPWLQLRAAIEAVFRSWQSPRAIAYREREGIPDTLGTAVTVQAMVFGNRGETSGSGVLFTRDPATGEATAYGDILFDAQGEDVVSGTHRTDGLGELARRLPAVSEALAHHARVLERYHADLCDIEFTIERGTLWLLQCRVGKRSPQAALRMAVEMAVDPDFPLTRREAVERVRPILFDPPVIESGPGLDVAPLGRGLPASPGLASGVIATSPDDALELAAAGASVILVRAETSPEDVPAMSVAVGLLTSRGGLASHAAVVARGWGIPAVVGASEVQLTGDGVSIAGRRFEPGGTITIDGSTGAIFDGMVVGSVTPIPESAILRGWAHELGIDLEPDPIADADPTTATGPVPPGPGPIDAGLVFTTIAIKGYATDASLVEALAATPDEVTATVAALEADGIVERQAGAIRLTAAGRSHRETTIESDRAALGPDGWAAHLDGFLDLDRAVKSIVTDWQMRATDGEPVLNDHADAAYDEAVLGRLRVLHTDAVAWIEPLVPSLARFGVYRTRLDRAAGLAAAGDGRFVASPRVDSYHSIWFELHEDLILLAGRTREDEVAAGRA